MERAADYLLALRHKYEKFSHSRPRERAPTDRDLDHIRVNLQHKTPHSSRWVFEKVICNKRNHQGYERILHLLTLIDEKGNIKERITVKIVGDGDPVQLRQDIRREVEPHKRLQALESRYIINFIANSWRPN
ncbi:hypothetical protein B5807_07652 [Epicoccum nigrum]|uniref:Uncharacterized protein n=1 Tax=Epicoccum nigrum TaxID=105696 RepID=A0A1Y2LWT9_EPING|nr:hypothetical protein B5807_07652 [Epicoccum nigrum]